MSGFPQPTASLPSVIVKASGDTTGATDPANIQAAINAMLPTGGTVGLFGNFSLATGITTYPGIALAGDRFLAADGYGGLAGTRLNALSTLNAPLITVKLHLTYPTRLYFPSFHDLVLSGTHAQTLQDGIYVDPVNGNMLDLFMKNVGIFDMGGHGLNHADPQTKTWIDGCYFENNQQSGIRSQSIIFAQSCYIYGNVLWGVDATSSSYLKLIDCQIWSNAAGGVQVWSVSTGALIANCALRLNGDATHPTIFVNSMGSGGTHLFRTVIENNVFYGNAGATDTQYFVNVSGGMDGVISGNSFLGQKSGNPAVKVAAHASNNLRVRDNIGFNPLGLLTNPLDTTNNRSGLAGTTGTMVASTDYVISEVDQYLSITAGTGVSISVKDTLGNVIQSGLTTFVGLLPVGFKVNAGAFSVAPTFVSYAN